VKSSVVCAALEVTSGGKKALACTVGASPRWSRLGWALKATRILPAGHVTIKLRQAHLTDCALTYTLHGWISLEIRAHRNQLEKAWRSYAIGINWKRLDAAIHGVTAAVLIGGRGKLLLQLHFWDIIPLQIKVTSLQQQLRLKLSWFASLLGMGSSKSKN
jgi:hypothetical protein